MRVRTLNDSKRFFVAVRATAEGDDGLAVGAANYQFVVCLIVVDVV